MIHTLRKTIAQTAWMLWLTCVCLASTAWASEHITARSYWEDATGQATLEVAQSKTFTPYQGVLSRGYTPAAIWIRLDIAPPANAQANDALVLRIRPVFLDEIILFDPLDTSGKNRKAGDTADWRVCRQERGHRQNSDHQQRNCRRRGRQLQPHASQHNAVSRHHRQSADCGQHQRG